MTTKELATRGRALFDENRSWVETARIMTAETGRYFNNNSIRGIVFRHEHTSAKGGAKAVRDTSRKPRGWPAPADAIEAWRAWK